MKQVSLSNQKIVHSEVQEATLHFQSSPFHQTDLTIQFTDKLMKLKTKGVSTIRKSVILEGIVSSIRDVKTLVEEAREVKSDQVEKDYLLHFFDCQKKNLGHIRAKIQENTPLQEVEFWLQEDNSAEN
jgi:L-lysine 2,3-aminomutase